MTATIGDLLQGAIRRLTAAGVGAPGLDARLLLAHVLEVDQATLIRDPTRIVDQAPARTFETVIARRCAREPVSRIVGYREFYGRRFTLGPAALDPRPDSETLVAAALAAPADARTVEVRILDLGTGSGALLVSLLAEWPRACGVGIDVDPAAVRIAMANACAHRVEARASFVVGDWDAAIDGRFDLIVANPPYIRSTDVEGLDPEVRDHEPRRALDGGSDGLAGHRAVADAACRLLVPGGRLVAEIGADQRRAVESICVEAGLSVEAIGSAGRDLAGRDRIVSATLKPRAGVGERAWIDAANRVMSDRRRPSWKAERSPVPSGGSGRHRGAISAEPLTPKQFDSVAAQSLRCARSGR